MRIQHDAPVTTKCSLLHLHHEVVHSCRWGGTSHVLALHCAGGPVMHTCGVVAVDVGLYVLAGHVFDVLRGAQDGPAKRRMLVGCRVQMVHAYFLWDAVDLNIQQL